METDQREGALSCMNVSMLRLELSVLTIEDKMRDT